MILKLYSNARKCKNFYSIPFSFDITSTYQLYCVLNKFLCCLDSIFTRPMFPLDFLTTCSTIVFVVSVVSQVSFSRVQNDGESE